MALSFKDFYDGQDLHIVRNNVKFNLHEYIDSGSAIPTYSIEYPKGISLSTERITIENHDGNLVQAQNYAAGSISSIGQLR